MTRISTTAEAARENARTAGGLFGTQEHTGPELTLSGDEPRGGSLTPKQLGIIGLGPAGKNTFDEYIDTHYERGDRPLRPYLPLDPSDDDEFFDAPKNTVLVADVDGEIIRYRSSGGYDWERLSARGTAQEPMSAGEVWAELFDDTGHMHPAKLDLPDGVLYSDRTHYVLSADTDQPMLADTVNRVLNGNRGYMASRVIFGDETESGVPEEVRGGLAFHVSGNTMSVLSGGRVVRELSLAGKQTIWRNGAVVIRSEPHDAGYGWEEAYRVTR